MGKGQPKTNPRPTRLVSLPQTHGSAALKRPSTALKRPLPSIGTYTHSNASQRFAQAFQAACASADSVTVVLLRKSYAAFRSASDAKVPVIVPATCARSAAPMQTRRFTRRWSPSFALPNSSCAQRRRSRSRFDRAFALRTGDGGFAARRAPLPMTFEAERASFSALELSKQKVHVESSRIQANHGN